MKFFDELKRRNVLRVGMAYAVTAWLAIQVVDTIFPAFGFGDAAVRFATLSFAVGLIPVLIIAWVYELTPDGIRRDDEVDRTEPASLESARKLDRVIIVVLALAVSYFAFDKFVLSADYVAPQKSVAVLPFLSQGSAEDGAYFADGMHYELVNRLSRISSLKVISRTSVMRYRDTDKSLPEIGEELSVGALLEGSVQRIGDKVRINVQLIDRQSEKHLWAEIYDRELTAENLFGIQSEISRAIAQALHAELSPQTLAIIDEVQTENSEAYDLYLRAIQRRTLVSGPNDYEIIKTLYERSVELDPDFLRAQAGLMEAYGRLVWIGADPDGENREKAQQLLSHIQDRWPDRYESHLALADYHYTVERDYAAALAEYRVAEALAPNEEDILFGITASLKRLNRNQEHLEYARRVVELDPENSLIAFDMVVALSRNGFGEEAVAFAEASRRKFPDDTTWPQTVVTYRLLHLGDVEAYLAFGEELRNAGVWADTGPHLTWLLYGEGEIDKALQHLAARMARLSGEYSWGSAQIDTETALLLTFEGREAEAAEPARRAYEFVRTWIESGRPFPSSDSRQWYGVAAYTAAVAGQAEATAEYRQAYRAAPIREPGNEKFNIRHDAQIDSLLNNAEAGWAIIAANVGMSNPATTPEYMAVHPLYQRLFGEVQGYKDFIANAKVLERNN